MSHEIDEIIERALREDMPAGDITSESVIPEDAESYAVIWAKESGVLAGIGLAEKVFRKIDSLIRFEILIQDGVLLQRGDEIAEIRGRSVSLLKGERTALNFLQRMSGIASMARAYVDAVKGTKARVLDTRKTTPGLRVLEKYAVKTGGGTNHRMHLSEMVMLKDNHIQAVGSVAAAVDKARKNIPAGIKIEVETANLEEVKQALESGADIIMLDNMTPEEVTDAVKLVSGRVPLEVSGMVTMRNIRKYAETGVDMISVGSLTHSYSSLDIAMDIK
jgi:nicotinate-nucleotide pyrophosphorylase (carboxylating)